MDAPNLETRGEDGKEFLSRLLTPISAQFGLILPPTFTEEDWEKEDFNPVPLKPVAPVAKYAHEKHAPVLLSKPHLSQSCFCVLVLVVYSLIIFLYYALHILQVDDPRL